MKTLRQAGFTLIELLVALTIITILAVSVYAALNPSQRLKDSKDARRSSDVAEILTAIHQSIVDNKGTLPTNLASLTAGAETQLGSGASGCTISNSNCTIAATACADLMSGAQALTSYLASMPIDPIGGTTATSAKTGYSVIKASTGIITVKACYTDGSSVISVSR